MYKTYEHPADIGIYGEGQNIEESFQEIAKALYSVIVDISTVESLKKIKFKLKEYTKEDLLFSFLNQLLSESDVNSMMFSDFLVKIDKKKDIYVLTAECFGDKLDEKKMDFKVEVKAVTYSQLEVIETKDKVITKCIVDV